ncbi:MAG: ATP-binding protein [Defluviitaleaceae bacterium]|nr:ATP-binding protein [Defluviitaleaceae bacterium]
MINRPSYLEKIHAVKQNEKIKIIDGVKRSGKTTLIAQFMDELNVEGVQKEQLLYFNFEQPDFQKILNADRTWLQTLEQSLDDMFDYYVFLDEVSQLKDMRFAIEKLAAKANVDLYLISSNASFLATLTTYLPADAFVFIHVFPLSFPEFMSGFPAHGFVPSTKYYWNSYLLSSFPYVTTLKNDRERALYLAELVDALLINDLMLHLSISNVHLLKYLVQFLMHHIGREISINKIATLLTCTQFPKVYPKMIDKYIQGLLDTFLIYKVNRYDIKEKQIVATSPKYYIADVGLQMPDHKHDAKAYPFILENIVFLELKKRGYDVFFGKIGHHQIDFVAKKEDTFEYYQVSPRPINPITLARKMRPIEKLRDGYPRFLLTLDQAGVRGNYDGLKHLSVFEWLMQP